MTIVTVRPDEKHLLVTFPYDADAVGRLKDAVPGWDRNFDPQTKAWKIGKPWLPKLIETMVEGGHTISDGSAPPPPPKRSSTGVAEFFGSSESDKVEAKARAEAIVASIPTPLRHRVLREYARLLYPDLYSGRR